MLWEWDSLLGAGIPPDIGWNPHMMSDLEKTVDLEQFFTGNKEMDQLLQTDSQNLANNDKGKTFDHPTKAQDSLLISDEAWALLQEMEANNDNSYLQQCSPISPPDASPLPAPLDDSVELSWKEISFPEISDNPVSVDELSYSENHFNLVKDPLLSKMTDAPTDNGSTSKNCNVKSVTTVKFDAFKDEVPPSAGVEFPLDITTPDILSLLVNQTLEFPENIPSPELKTIQEDDIASEISVKESPFDFLQTVAVDSVKEGSSSSILSLKIGNKDGDTVTLGKGALLQRKRKASRSSVRTAEAKVVKLALNDERDVVPTASVSTNSCSSDSSVLQIEELNVVEVETSTEETDFSFNKPSGQKYIEMRIKNNEASRRSRKSRKQKEQEMEELAVKLEKDNTLLQMKVDKLEKLTEFLKAELIRVVSNKK